MTAPFLVLGLPRSRTAWLSRFLTYGDYICGHEQARHFRTLGDVSAWFSQPCIGSAETAAAPFWRLFDKFAPGLKVVVVRRDPGEVVDSLMRLPVEFDRDILAREIHKLDRKLDQVAARVPGAITVQFDELDREDNCARVFEHCLPYSHDHEHWARLSAINVQADMRGLMRYMVAYREPLGKLAAVAKHAMMTDLAVRCPLNAAGMTYQVERFDDWLSDAGDLLAEHHFQIGEAPENWRNKNIPALRALDTMGYMRITTARCNGRMFGYLMTLITPSLVTAGQTVAVNTAFFADPSAPGVGLKLQRAALSALRDEGINEVMWETNTVGSAGRIGAMYRRLGAEEKGSVFRLRLKDAA